jgi:carboxymethylenebutenolidase
VARCLTCSCLLSIAAFLGCNGGSSRPAVEQPTSATPPAAPEGATGEAAPRPGSLPDGISEAEFKSWHTLKQGGAPALRGEMVDLGGGARAYLSLPPGATAPVPGVVVIHEWWGLNDHVKHWADRLAADGYAALAVDLYGQVATTPDEAMKLMNAVDDESALRLLRSAHAYLVSDNGVRAPKTASIGWCFGGAWSLRLAMAEPALDAAVIYYGRLVTDPAQLGTIKAPVLGVFANQDKGIPPDQVNAFEAALAKAGVENKILRYDADHAFANPSGERYDDTDAEAAWRETRAFLAANLR